MAALPKLITHNYDPDRGPFKNICNLPKAKAETVLAEIDASGKRSFKAGYLRRRLIVEDWLIAQREKKLGLTPLARPIYFFLGDFADGKDASRQSSFVMPLEAFPPNSLTFTYPDSMASLPIATKEHHLPQRKTHHGQVLTLSEITEIVAEFGMLGDRWKREPSMVFDRFVEVQVWDDRPIRRYLENVDAHQRQVALEVLTTS